MIAFFFIFLLSSIFAFFLLKSDYQTVYGDSGFMWIQIQNLIESNFSSFSFLYSGSSFDPTGKFAPFVTPFLGSYNQKLYIVFSPYFPLVVSFCRIFSDSNIFIYLFQAIAFSFSLLFFFSIMGLFFRDWKWSFGLTLIFFLCTTIFAYNLAIHEYSIGIAFLYGGIFFFIKSIKEKQYNLFLSGIFFGISLFFRLEFVFTIFSWLAVSILFSHLNLKEVLLKFVPYFVFLLLVLFVLNHYIYGHPLSFRYTLTMYNPETENLSRLLILNELLFGKSRGFFYQSPYLLLLMIVGVILIFKNSLWKVKKSNEVHFLAITFLSMILIIAQAPNHGDHLSPRYLFGVYPSIFLFCALSLKHFLDNRKEVLRWFVVAFIFGSLVFSFRQFLKTVNFVRESDKTVASINALVRQRPEANIIFLDQALPKNLQTIFFEKNQYYVKKEDLSEFFSISKLALRNTLILSSEEISQCIFEEKFCRIDSSIPAIKMFLTK